MMIGGIRGTTVREKTGWFSYAALSNIWCQEMGIVCVPSWISMRQKGGDVVDAAWQNPPLRGEESIGSQAMRGCHVRKGVWYHTIRYGGIACCQCPCCLSKVFTHLEKGPLFHQQTLPICWTSGYVYVPEVLVECHHLWCVLFKTPVSKTLCLFDRLTQAESAARLTVLTSFLEHNFLMNFNFNGASNNWAIFYISLQKHLQRTWELWKLYVNVISPVHIPIYCLFFNISIRWTIFRPYSMFGEKFKNKNLNLIHISNVNYCCLVCTDAYCHKMDWFWF